MKTKLITKADIVLAICLLVLGLASPFVMRGKAAEKLQVEISCEGEVLQTLPLEGNKNYYLAFLLAEEADDAHGARLIDLNAMDALMDPEMIDNLIIIEGGTVRVEYANCHGNDCVRSGNISMQGQFIACLPHRLMISIVGAGDPNVPDAVIR